MSKYETPSQFAVFEREPQYCSAQHPLLLGPYKTEAEAEEDRVRYGYDRENFYVAKIAPDRMTPVRDT